MVYFVNWVRLLSRILNQDFIDWTASAIVRT